MLILDGLKRRLIRGENGVHFDRPSLSYDQKDYVPLEVKSGSLVVIHGNLVHQRSFLLCCVLHVSTWYMLLFAKLLCVDSFENQSPKSRHALSLHVVDTDGFKWASDNWLVFKNILERILLVSSFHGIASGFSFSLNLKLVI